MGYSTTRRALKERQDADEVECVGLRLRLLEQQAEAGDITLPFGDERRPLSLPIPTSRAWAKRGSDLRIEASGQPRKRAMIGAFDFARAKAVCQTARNYLPIHKLETSKNRVFRSG